MSGEGGASFVLDEDTVRIKDAIYSGKSLIVRSENSAKNVAGQWKRPTNSRCLVCHNLVCSCGAPRLHVDPERKRHALAAVSLATPYAQKKLVKALESAHGDEEKLRNAVHRDEDTAWRAILQLWSQQSANYSLVDEEYRHREDAVMDASRLFQTLMGSFNRGMVLVNLCAKQRECRTRNAQYEQNERATIQGQYRSFREFVELIVSEAAHRQSFSLQEGKDRAAMQAMEGKYRNVMNQCWEKRYELEMFCMEGRDDVEKEWSNRMDQLHASLRRGTQVISAWENERHLVEDELLLHYHNLDEEEKKERVNVVFRFKQERKKVEKFMAEKYAQRKTVDADEGKARDCLVEDEVGNRQRIYGDRASYFRRFEKMLAEQKVAREAFVAEGCASKNALHSEEEEARFALMQRMKCEEEERVVWIRQKADQLKEYSDRLVEIKITYFAEEGGAREEILGRMRDEEVGVAQWIKDKAANLKSLSHQADTARANLVKAERDARSACTKQMKAEESMVGVWIAQKNAERDSTVREEMENRRTLTKERDEHLEALMELCVAEVEQVHKRNDENRQRRDEIWRQAECGRKAVLSEEAEGMESLGREWSVGVNRAVALYQARQQSDAMITEDKERSAVIVDEVRELVMLQAYAAQELDRFRKQARISFETTVKTLETHGEQEQRTIVDEESAAWCVLMEAAQLNRESASFCEKMRLHEEMLARQQRMAEESRCYEEDEEPLPDRRSCRLSFANLRQSMLLAGDENSADRDLVAHYVGHPVNHVSHRVVMCLAELFESAIGKKDAEVAQMNHLRSDLATVEKRIAIAERGVVSAKESITFHKEKALADHKKFEEDVKVEKDLVKKEALNLKHQEEKLQQKLKKVDELKRRMDALREEIHEAYRRR